MRFGLKGSAIMFLIAIGPSRRKLKFGARRYVFTEDIEAWFYFT